MYHSMSSEDTYFSVTCFWLFVTIRPNVFIDFIYFRFFVVFKSEGILHCVFKLSRLGSYRGVHRVILLAQMCLINHFSPRPN